MHSHIQHIAVVVLLASSGLAVAAELPSAQVRVMFTDRLGPLEIDKMALGQGGTSPEATWADRIPEIRALRPRVIRLFVQEYFDLLPDRDRYHFETLDQNVDMIIRAGATPLMCICFKPRMLFPEIDQDIVEPQDYAAWEDLIEALVRHYRERDTGIRYWEVANEPDIGEDGGCPYRFQPESYVRYYRHSVAAILKADPDARVGGPAVASVRSPIFPALLDACQQDHVPLHFVSWHIYSSNPTAIGDTVRYAKELLAKYPSLQPETFLDEWNMDLMNPPLDARFQPCFVAETIFQMKAAGLDYSCYYHIRDFYVDQEQFAPFMSPHGAAFMTRWWNRMPQFDGLFDYQNHVRPAYFAFKLLSRMAGDRLELVSTDPQVHGFATRDDKLLMENLLLWNFSDQPKSVTVSLNGLSAKRRVRHIRLDALAPSSDENAQLQPEPYFTLAPGSQQIDVQFEPYAVHYWSLE